MPDAHAHTLLIGLFAIGACMLVVAVIAAVREVMDCRKSAV